MVASQVLSKTQRKTPTVVHPGFKITRIRSFYSRKARLHSSTEDITASLATGSFSVGVVESDAVNYVMT